MDRDLTGALAIAQELLDITGRCLLSGDFARFAPCFSVPTTIGTFDGQVSITSLDDMEARFRNVVAHYKSLQATDIVRHIVAAEWFDDRTINSTHQGRVVSGETLMQAPYTVFSILKNTGSRWQIVFSEYAIPDSEQHNDALLKATPKRETTND